MSMPKISESEWEVMKLLWDKNPITSEEIIEGLANKKDWSKETIKTFIIRLTKKGAISYTKEGRVYHYYPIISEEECKREENKSFLEKVYNGSLGILFTNFLKDEDLSIEEIEELEDLLKDKKENSKKKK